MQHNRVSSCKRWCAALELAVCVLPAACAGVWLIPSLIRLLVELFRHAPGAPVGPLLLMFGYIVGGLFGITALGAVASSALRAGDVGRLARWHTAGLITVVVVAVSASVTFFPALCLGMVPWLLLPLLPAALASLAHLGCAAVASAK